MIPFQERKKIRKIVYSKITIFVLTGVLFVVSVGAWRVHKKALVAMTERDISARALADSESRMKELQISLARLNSNQGIEEEVREKYTVALPGEEVVVVVDENAKKSENGEVPASNGWWQKILSFFK
ncbi:hypothetical protein AUJ77_01875 [Candidatus Nomurabacteria bacterium CG1_02_43_90]|uniref:Septum formation initiator n=1 Tax=Candidatus Nomurabacteria bacterium CG1_02_43_90 TaxID=1805281 RepID=A0A1J4V0T6_9BACT|nr:MAG: hypothetical protein AUJ77_01875 [Candidatus Nomurabacteria bacterium CG1_02_43_90]